MQVAPSVRSWLSGGGWSLYWGLLPYFSLGGGGGWGSRGFKPWLTVTLFAAFGFRFSKDLLPFCFFKGVLHGADWVIVLAFNDTSKLVVILCRLPEKGGKVTEEIVEEMKDRDREERGTEIKVKKQKHSTSTLTCYKDSRPCPTVSQYQLDAPVT